MMKEKDLFVKTSLQFIERERRSVSYSTYKNYLTALNSFARFGGRSYSFREVTPSLLMTYQRWLISRNISLNTISCYMRSLRAVWHKQGGLIEVFEPVYTGLEHTRKRAVGLSEVRRLRRLHLPYMSRLDVARDLFLFSFYALGMPFIDVAFLRPQNLRGNMLVYRRHKTGREVRVPIHPCMSEIIDKYIIAHRTYVFPILSHHDPEEAFVQYMGKLCNYNRSLKLLAKAAGFRCGLTSYVVRHTWASLAYKGNVDLPVISRALGHANTATTQIYIAEIDDNRLAEASRKMLEGVFGEV